MESDEDWCDIGNESNGTTTGGICVAIETYSFTIHKSNIRVGDLVILVCNVVFLVFLAVKFVPTLRKLVGAWPLFSILYCEILAIPIVCCVHEIVSMCLDHGHTSAKATHYVLRGVILTTEISVVVFGLTFKKYHGRKRTLVATMIVILVLSIGYTILEGILDTLKKNSPLSCYSKNLFTHGGMIFSFITSTILSLSYLITFLLYLCNLHQRWDLPSKKSFYRYALFLSLVNVIQAVGSMLWYEGTHHRKLGEAGICMTLITTDIYLITFAPVVYWIFLSNYFRMNTSTNSNSSPDRVSYKSTNTGANDTIASHTSPKRGWSWRISLNNFNPRSNSNPVPIYKKILSDESTNMHDDSVSEYGSFVDHQELSSAYSTNS